MKSTPVPAGTLKNSNARIIKTLYPRVVLTGSETDTKAMPTSPSCGIAHISGLISILSTMSKACRSWTISRAAYLPWWEKRGMFLFFPYSPPSPPYTHTHTKAYNPGQLFLWVSRGPLCQVGWECREGLNRWGGDHSQLLYNHHILIPGYLQSCLKTVSAEMG